MYVKRRSKSVQSKKLITNSKSSKTLKTDSQKSNDQDPIPQKKINTGKQNLTNTIKEEEIENDNPDFSKLFELEKKNNLKFIVCADISENEQKIKYNWFDSTHKAKDIYDFFFPKIDCKIFWKDDLQKVQYLEPNNEISQIDKERALIFALKKKSSHL